MPKNRTRDTRCAAYCHECGAATTLRCSNCDAENPTLSRFCHQCGTALQDASQAGATALGAARVQAGIQTRCPRCGEVNDPDSVFCYRCGLPLGDVRRTRESLIVGRPAGFRVRLAAFVIDGILLGLPSYLALDLGLGLDADATNLVSALIDLTYFTARVVLW